MTVADILDSGHPVIQSIDGHNDDVRGSWERSLSFKPMQAEAVEFGEAFLRAQKGAR
jgi:hypothetical protein